MIATGTDIKPLEVLIFLRDVRSRVYFEQMKGQGTQVLSPIDLLEIGISQTPSVTFRLLKTTMLTSKDDQPLVGALEAFDKSAPMQRRRLDPEGIRVWHGNSVFVSDEYGPFSLEVSLSGQTQRLFPTPDSIAVQVMSIDPKEEDAHNQTARAVNSGWEGLTFGPELSDGRRVLIVAVDNDYVPEEPTLFAVFAIDVADLPDCHWSKLPKNQLKTVG